MKHSWSTGIVFWRFCTGLALLAGLAFSGQAPACASGFQTPAAGSLPSEDGDWESGFHVPGITGQVFALLVGQNGNLYVGGEIVTAGGMTVGNVAMFDGATWTDLSGGVSAPVGTPGVYALALDANGDVYAGGTFT